MKPVLLVALAAVSFAQTSPVERTAGAVLQATTRGQTALPEISLKTLKEIETTTDARLQAPMQEPWNMLGDTRGTYLPGYGAVFTFEMTLANLPSITPFHLAATPEEKKSGHDRKAKNLIVLKATLREMIVSAATTLSAMPGNEQISFEAYLFSFSWEDRTGLPERVIVSANHQQVADAAARHASKAEMASLFQERSE